MAHIKHIAINRKYLNNNFYLPMLKQTRFKRINSITISDCNDMVNKHRSHRFPSAKLEVALNVVILSSSI